MSDTTWIFDAIGNERADRAKADASRRRLFSALGVGLTSQETDDELRFVGSSYELAVYEVLEVEDASDKLREAALKAFQLLRTLPPSEDPIICGEQLLRLGALAVLADRGADMKRILVERGMPDLTPDSADWGTKVWGTVLRVWLLLLRKNGWQDLDAVQAGVVELRNSQRQFEPTFLAGAEQNGKPAPAWRLVSCYHVAKAAEILGEYLTQGVSEGHYDISQQLEAQFDRAIGAAARCENAHFETLVRLLGRCASQLVENCIWTVTRSVNTRVTKFVEQVVSRGRQNPIFEVLPPQRKTLREAGLLGSGHRSVVVSLPTSSGKTFIAQFRILQALNQFDQEQGWVAYLAPTRALVNQLAVKLRRDFQALGIVVERVSPALEVDGLEAKVLSEADPATRFRVLVTTPEKLDLMLRTGWEEKIGRPLTLVVVDEAHGLGSPGRGIKLELLLATINRECRHAQFLLLTPFLHNAKEIARWLAPNSNQDIELGFEWSPNDRAIAVARIERGTGTQRASFKLSLNTVHTSKNTLAVPESLQLIEGRPLGLSWSKVSNSPGKIAAVTAEILSRRGTVIVLADKPKNTWPIAKALADGTPSSVATGDMDAIQQFLEREFGADYPLKDLLSHRVGVHHAGMSDEAKTLVEWLTEKGALKALVATTTIAQGVNFPVSGVVMASYQYPYGKDMPPEDFWNLAGRAGRVDQGDLGLVVLAAESDEKEQALNSFISQSVSSLNSTLIAMVQAAEQQGALLDLERLSYRPEWSSFLQYLAHTYRQIGDHDRFATEVEQVLRGTLGFQSLRRSNPDWANKLVTGVTRYASRLQGKPLKLVDSTGFSWESVSNTLVRLSQESIREEVWGAELFTTRRDSLQKMMGILLQVPELRENLEIAVGGPVPDGDKLARMVADWVQGKSLRDMAQDYFKPEDGSAADPVDAMTKCCQSVFGRLTQTAAWGLAALQALTFRDRFDTLPADEQLVLRNLPARVYYGVNSDEAIALRLMGVPRQAAQSLATEMRVTTAESSSAIRARLRSGGVAPWVRALGPVGNAYHRVWSIIEGET